MNNIWQETTDPQTGKSSLTENIRPKTIGKFCSEQDHEFEDPRNIREAVCLRCGLIARYVVGKHILKDGKLLPIKKS